MKRLIACAIIFMSFSLLAQKKVIDHTVYSDWKSLSASKISNDGKFISYQIKPHRGDGYLYIYDVENNTLDSIYRASSAQFSGESSYLAFKITPGFDTLRNCELEKVDKKKWPKDSLGILYLKNDSLVKFPKIKSISLNDESDWGVFMFDHNKVKEEKKKRIWCKKKREAMEYKSDGKVIWVFHPEEERLELKDVKNYILSEKAGFLAYTIHKKADCDSMEMNVINLAKQSTLTMPHKYTSIDKFTFNKQEDKLVMLASEDSAKVKNYSLLMMDSKNAMVTLLADTNSAFIREGKAVSINYAPYFTDDGSKIYFGTSDIAREEPEDTLLKSEKVELDIWHYADKRLQPKQLLDLKRDEKRTDLFVYHLDKESAIQLSDDTLRVFGQKDLKGDLLLGWSRERYMYEDNWKSPRSSDYYTISISTGERKMIAEEVLFGVDLSPSGNHFITYDGNEGKYYATLLDAEDQTDKICLNCKTEGIKWTSDMNGMPMDAYPLGVIGWDKTEDLVYLQSEYDVWVYSFEKDKLVNFTGDANLNTKIKITPKYWSRDSVYIDMENTYFTGFDEKTKGTHFYKAEDHGDHVDVFETGYFDAEVPYMARSKNKKSYVLRKRTFVDYPELFIFDGDFDQLEQISVTNPQQSEYNWGTVELVNWTSYDGIELEGLLYKPEDFDENKEYPLMVYFYELYSDRFHTHYIPKPTASIIYATEYASAGYVVFMPDIRYKPGHPAKSAYDCIMSGTDHILNMLPNIDSNRMALQGQSWGGYQTAQLVTMTNRYAAAMAGAPVSNMFSAYGGIRWGSGMNRQFQYEKTQSRIGATIWEKPELYIENSPLFHVPNIETPLMIMHNDKDGAVPWYQGIEMFTAMQRLGKKAWLLNYNGDQHNLMQNANRIDLSIRMRQFFDHYLLDKPAPSWMVDGLPAIKKGKELRYD